MAMKWDDEFEFELDDSPKKKPQPPKKPMKTDNDDFFDLDEPSQSKTKLPAISSKSLEGSVKKNLRGNQPLAEYVNNRKGYNYAGDSDEDLPKASSNAKAGLKLPSSKGGAFSVAKGAQDADSGEQFFEEIVDTKFQKEQPPQKLLSEPSEENYDEQFEDDNYGEDFEDL